jgi:hypothetical protein
MGLFSSRPKAAEPGLGSANQIPVTPIDLSKQYDLYCSEFDHDRLYEDIRFVGRRTFGPISGFTIGDYLEIEAVNGARFLIPQFGIRLICEHGTQPTFKVLRRRRNPREG